MVEEIVYSVWVDNNPLTKNRIEALQTIKDNIGVKHVLVTPDILKSMILPDYPFHPGYKYLSRIHKSDYIRCYLMHHYGGGYSDIKRQYNSWKPYFDTINNNSKIFLIGTVCTSKHLAIPEEYYTKNKFSEIKNLKRKDNQKKIAGAGYMICRPYSPFTNEWYNKLHKRLDFYFNELSLNPAVYSREAFDRPPEKWCNEEKDLNLRKLECPKSPTKYPINWNRILGQIFYPLQMKYLNHIKTDIPTINDTNYANYAGGFRKRKTKNKKNKKFKKKSYKKHYCKN